MKLRTIILGAGALIVIGIVAAAVFLVSNLDAIVEAAIEKYGSEITGSPVRAAGVSISPSTGEGTIRGLRVGNPQGFPSGDAFALGQITLRVDVRSLTETPIVIPEILIAAPSVNAVVNAQGQTNLDAIRKNAERYTGGSGGGGSKAEPSASSGGQPTLLRIEKFTFENGTVTADLTGAGGKKFDAALPAVRLSKLGGSSGATPGAIGKQVAVVFTKNATNAIAQKGADALIDEHVGGAEGEAAKSLLRGIMNK